MRIHATALLVGETGLLIRGGSGQGKTSLALALIGEAARAGHFARLVGDDAVVVEPRSGRLLARPHPAIAGRVERRGVGVVPIEHAPACIVRIVVDLVGPDDPAPDRMPEAGAARTTILGIELPRLMVPAGTTLYERLRTILDVLAAFSAGS